MEEDIKFLREKVVTIKADTIEDCAKLAEETECCLPPGEARIAYLEACKDLAQKIRRLK